MTQRRETASGSAGGDDGRPRVGLRHPTVVPTNFEPADDARGDDDRP
jgi:hypothetical protein